MIIDNNILISYVVISRNNKLHLLKCLESLVNQNSINSEIILFVNSKDKELKEIL